MHKTEKTISQTHIHPEITLKRKKFIFDLCDTLSVQVRVLKLCMLTTSFKFNLFIPIFVILVCFQVQSYNVSFCGWWFWVF